MSDLDRHAARIAELVEQFEASHDEQVREKAFDLIQNIDHLHRTCVWRLFELMTELGGKGLVERIAADPAVKTLFVLYDLIPSDPLQPVSSSVGVTGPYGGGFVPLESLKLGGRSAWQVAFAQADLPAGSLHAVEIDRVPVLLCSLDGNVFAYRNVCPGSVLPLHLGALVDGEIYCPWHGCRYDVRTGKQIHGASQRDLEPLPVTVRDGMIHIAASS